MGDVFSRAMPCRAPVPRRERRFWCGDGYAAPLFEQVFLTTEMTKRVCFGLFGQTTQIS
jgi:hypothetical protein